VKNVGRIAIVDLFIKREYSVPINVEMNIIKIKKIKELIKNEFLQIFNLFFLISTIIPIICIIFWIIEKLLYFKKIKESGR